MNELIARNDGSYIALMQYFSCFQMGCSQEQAGVDPVLDVEAPMRMNA